MLFQIKELILWPRRNGFQPRRVKFQTGKLNVITGASRTGKSAVIPIIDYWLGSRNCAIPVKTIRDSCSWFGIIVETEHGQKLLARREPGTQRSTEEMLMVEAAAVQVPDLPVKNTTADNVRRALDELSGLSNLDFASGEVVSGYFGRPSFRDLSAFVFQPQNIVANPDVLFFKADTKEHREKLRNIFPYVLNAITPELLAKQHELRRTERELNRRERELRVAQEVSAEWLAQILSKVQEARELGLIADSLPAEMTRDEMVELLKRVIANTDRTMNVSSVTISESLTELADLEKEESAISQHITTLRRRQGEMKRLRESATSYHDALVIQRDRLKVADWLTDLHTGTEGCPVCGNELKGSTEQLQALQASLRELEQSTGSTREIPAAFEREYQRVEDALREATEKLRAVQIRSEALSRRSNEAQQQQFQAKRLERFIGSLESDIRTYERVGTDSALSNDVDALRERVRVLRIEVDPAGIKSRVARSLSIVNANAGKLLPSLDVERPGDPISLDIDNLTLKVTSSERDDYLWEIGSGSNWLSYHVAAMLGLHQFFMSQRHNCVPTLLLVDQPSQVYFPKLLVRREGKTESEPAFDRDEDVAAVRKAFAVLSMVVAAAHGRLQVIVLDHAPEVVWQKLPDVILVEEWRDGRTLVPMEWLP